ncbi:MAG: MarR family transcriptional regulator [Byssovorax sp.]
MSPPSAAPPPGSDPGPPAAVRAWERLLAVQRRALASVRDGLERDMTLLRFALLGAVDRRPGQTIAELSRALGVKTKNLGGVLERAERDGLCERRADPASRRAWTVHLTPRGKQAVRDAERRHEARLGRVFAALTAPEVEALAALLDKLCAALPDPPAPAPRPSAGPPAHPTRSGAGKRRRTLPKRSP